MKRIQNYIKDYPWLAQAIIWGTVFFIFLCSSLLIGAVIIEISKSL